MHGHTPLVAITHEQQRLLAEHEDRSLLQEVHCDDRCAGLHKSGAIGDRRGSGASVGQEPAPFLPS